MCLTRYKKWEVYIYKGGRETLAIAQAVILGQTFGMLSGNPNDLLLADTFHGTILAWVRQAGEFRVNRSVETSSILDTSNLEAAWKSWIQDEEAARVTLALHIHDLEFSALLRHEPLIRHAPSRLPTCSSEAEFSAPTAAKWYELLHTVQSSTQPETPDAVIQQPAMAAYGTLASIQASLSESISRPLEEDQVLNLRNCLKLWYKSRPICTTGPDNDPFALMILWHDTFMSLYVDFDLLERVVGRDGTLPNDRDQAAVVDWANSPDGRHCVAHALLILKRLEALPMSIVPAIHVPRAVFCTGLVLYCYIKCSRPSSRQMGLDLPELQVFGTQSASTSASGLSPLYSVCHEFDPSTFNDIVNLLKRQGHWGISKSFASILDVLMEDIADDWEDDS